MQTQDTSTPARLAVAGIGLIGRRHAELVAEEAALVAFADPSPEAEAAARAFQVPHYPDLASLLAQERVDGVIIATPNQRHLADGLTAISHRVAALIEKPIAADLAEAAELVAAAEAAGVPLLIGHHRRHNPIIAAAKAEIAEGALGRIVAIHGACWLRKPESYFDAAWRRSAGAGPILVNLIHDIDLLLHLCGPVVAVQAMASQATRGFEVEDTATALLQFESGALGTITLSDTINAPWSWELSAAENPTYPATGASSYWLGGEMAALSIPDLTIWETQGAPSWHAQMVSRCLAVKNADPLRAQIRHFAEVALGHAAPLVDGRAGMRALCVIEAIRSAAASGEQVLIDQLA